MRMTKEYAESRRREIQQRKLEQFWELLQKPVGCWLFDGAKEMNGYGYLKNPLGDDPKYISAHRLAWLLKNGPIPDGMRVLHKCDIRACCNPDHLFLGTDADNSRDMRTKGRHTRGEQSMHARLTEDQVRSIRSEYRKIGAHRSNAMALARKYGVARNTIINAALGRFWKHVT